MKQFQPSGLTLVEVVVSIALLGTLLFSTLLSSSTHLRQIKHAEEKREATVQLDQLLSVWSQQGYTASTFPRIADEQRLATSDLAGEATRSIQRDFRTSRWILQVDTLGPTALPGTEAIAVALVSVRSGRQLCRVEIVRGIEETR